MKGNFIGSEPNRAHPQVNQNVGISVFGSASLIGGLEDGAGNEIAWNKTGVYVDGTLGNAILSNRIYANQTIGIDLDAQYYKEDDNGNLTKIGDALGATSNDLGDADEGANHLQNFPIITEVVSDKTVPPGGPNTRINGTLNSRPDADYTLQFFYYNPDPRVLGTITVHTDANGNAPFSFGFYLSPTLPVAMGSYYTATATDAAGNTSELLPKNGPVQLANISTRGNVGTDDNIMIGGFFVDSPSPKKVIIRALGPSVPAPDRLADPSLELYDSNGALLAKNDDWRSDQQQQVIDSGVPPASDAESAIVARLAAGNYTAQVRGVDRGTGTAIVEIYDLDEFPGSAGRLTNISTRALVGTDDHVLIGGLIVRGDSAERFIVRAISPDLGDIGLTLQDPVLELRDSNGALVQSNDDWQDDQRAEIVATGLQPHDDRDCAIVASVAPGSFTAIVRGKDGATGVALVEFYDLTN